MKTITFKILLLSLIMIFFYQCKTDVLTQDEKARVFSGEANEPMKLFTINTYADSLFLRQKTRPVHKKHIETEEIQLLKQRMYATVTNPDNVGLGIAAPQIGVSLSMVYVQRLDKEGQPYEVYFNPVVEELGDSINSGMEGCLSIPYFRGSVERSHNIKLSYLDSLGIKQNENINGFVAVIFQHEIDHLSGVLYFDHIFNGFDGLIQIDEE